MKQKLLVILAIIICFGISGCQSNQNTKAKQTDSKQLAEEAEDAEDSSNYFDVNITFEDQSREEKDENGALLLTITGNLPIVTVEGNDVATEKINAYYKESQKNLEDQIQEYIQYANDDYVNADADRQKYWNGYALGESYQTARVDSSIISIIEDSYEYAGGAHPNSYRTAQNFDTITGELLKLEDIFTDTTKAKEFVNEYLLKLMKDRVEEYGYFEDYENSVGDILTDDTWYLSDEGLVVICNEYIVSPHAAGIQEFVIPYSEFPYLVEQYQKH